MQPITQNSAITDLTPLSAPHNKWLALFQTVNLRLKISVLITLGSLAIIAYQGILGMQQSADSLEGIYREGMQHTARAGQITRAQYQAAHTRGQQRIAAAAPYC